MYSKIIEILFNGDVKKQNKLLKIVSNSNERISKEDFLLKINQHYEKIFKGLFPISEITTVCNCKVEHMTAIKINSPIVSVFNI